MELEAIVTLEAGEGFTYQLVFPIADGEGGGGGSILILVWVLMKREGGLLLALPADGLPEDFLSLDSAEGREPMFGPHTTLTVPGMLQDGTSLVASGQDLDVMVVDADGRVSQLLEPLTGVAEGIAVCFGGDPLVAPDPELLMAYTKEWLALQQGQRITFYSAAEEVQDEVPQRLFSPKPPPKAKAKRPTTASLAEQLAGIAELLPAMTSQMAQLQEDQNQLRAQLAGPPKLPPRASQMPVSAPLQKFSQMLGSPPRTKQPLALSPPPKKADVEKVEEDPEQEFSQMPGGGILAQAVLEQSRALTSLVSQLQSGGDPLLDGQQSSSGVSLSSRGAQGREKLQNELANRSGNFFLAVLQNAQRRVKPASKLPPTIESMQEGDFSMVTYLERFGGYGACREMGLVQFSLAHIFDCALMNDMDGVREHLALTMTAVEQAVQDGNKWDLAYQLILLEEPPSQIWSYRNAVTQGRLRAFAPLCPQRWATVALAYAKEVDYIQNRRLEMTKKTQPAQAQQPSSPKKSQKGKKGKGGGNAESSNATSGEA